MKKYIDVKVTFINHFDPDIDSMEVAKTFEAFEYTHFKLTWNSDKYLITLKEKRSEY